MTWNIYAAEMFKLSGQHELCILLICKSYQDDMDYDLLWCLHVEGDMVYAKVRRLYVEVIKMTWIICAYLWKISRRHSLCMVLTRKSYQDGTEYDIVLFLYLEKLSM